MTHKDKKIEQCFCQSYYDDDNVLQDCTCGKCDTNPNPYKDIKEKCDKLYRLIDRHIDLTDGLHEEIENYLLKEVIPMVEKKTYKKALNDLEKLLLKCSDCQSQGVTEMAGVHIEHLKSQIKNK